jgi:shikimate kinase
MANKRNIILGGFMGTGKTTVGQIVADYIGWHFVDTDDEIVHRFGKSIPAIFAAQGEATFRRYETVVAQSLAAGSEQVIATGGGLLVDPANLAMMQASGFVVCLTADPLTIEQRLIDEHEGRPLAANWRDLLASRATAYAKITHQIETTGKAPRTVAEEVIALWREST